MSMKRGMLKSIQYRYGDIEQESLCVLGTILDPRFKLKGFSTASSAAHARMLLVTECESHISSLQQETENDKPHPKRRRKEKTSSALWSLFDELIAESENNDGSGNCGNEAEVVVEMYLKEPVLSHSKHIHPLEYWQSKKAIWPSLAHLASKYLGMPPSAASERLFSSASDIVSTERNRLLPEKAEMLLFIKKNLPIMDLCQYAY